MTHFLNPARLSSPRCSNGHHHQSWSICRLCVVGGKNSVVFPPLPRVSGQGERVGQIPLLYRAPSSGGPSASIGEGNCRVSPLPFCIQSVLLHAAFHNYAPLTHTLSLNTIHTPTRTRAHPRYSNCGYGVVSQTSNAWLSACLPTAKDFPSLHTQNMVLEGPM